MTRTEGFLQHYANAVGFGEMWASIVSYVKYFICGEAYRHILRQSDRVMQSLSRIMYEALLAALLSTLPHHWSIVQRELTCIQLLVYWCLVVQYGTHTTGTLNYLADCVEELHPTKHVSTTFWLSKATESIVVVHVKHLKMQPNAEQMIKYE